jgi:hypothetical protein
MYAVRTGARLDFPSLLGHSSSTEVEASSDLVNASQNRKRDLK